MQMKPFDRTDWYGFSGAEKFVDGREPLIGQVDNIMVIADGRGIYITIFHDETGENYTEYFWPEADQFHQDPTWRPEIAEKFINLLLPLDSEILHLLNFVEQHTLGRPSASNSR